MRASRLVTLLGLLQAHGRMSTRQLAAELEVCERTVLRDIEALSSAGIPVYAIRGRHGGFELLDGFTSDLAGLIGRGAAPVPSRASGGRRAALTSPGAGRSRPAVPAVPGAGAAGSRPAGSAPAEAGRIERALIRLSPGGRRLAALLGRPTGLHIRRSTAPVASRPDWIDAWVRVESREAAVLDLLALGAEVEVVRPPELRAELARVARRIADLHTDGPDDPDDPGSSAEGGAAPQAVPRRTAARPAAGT